jgi:hypothetical protein
VIVKKIPQMMKEIVTTPFQMRMMKRARIIMTIIAAIVKWIVPLGSWMTM